MGQKIDSNLQKIVLQGKVFIELLVLINTSANIKMHIFNEFSLIPQDAPLSSKVAMFNNAVSQHNDSQMLNPFSQAADGRKSPKPKFSKEEYGK